MLATVSQSKHSTSGQFSNFCPLNQHRTHQKLYNFKSTTARLIDKCLQSLASGCLDKSLAELLQAGLGGFHLGTSTQVTPPPPPPIFRVSLHIMAPPFRVSLHILALPFSRYHYIFWPAFRVSVHIMAPFLDYGPLFRYHYILCPLPLLVRTIILWPPFWVSSLYNLLLGYHYTMARVEYGIHVWGFRN